MFTISKLPYCVTPEILVNQQKRTFQLQFFSASFQIINSSSWKMINFWVKEFNFIRKKESGRHTVLCRSILNSAKLDDRVQKIIHHAELRDSKDIALLRRLSESWLFFGQINYLWEEFCNLTICIWLLCCCLSLNYRNHTLHCTRIDFEVFFLKELWSESFCNFNLRLKWL